MADLESVLQYSPVAMRKPPDDVIEEAVVEPRVLLPMGAAPLEGSLTWGT